MHSYLEALFKSNHHIVLVKCSTINHRVVLYNKGNNTDANFGIPLNYIQAFIFNIDFFFHLFFIIFTQCSKINTNTKNTSNTIGGGNIDISKETFMNLHNYMFWSRKKKIIFCYRLKACLVKIVQWFKKT